MDFIVDFLFPFLFVLLVSSESVILFYLASKFGIIYANNLFSEKFLHGKPLTLATLRELLK